MDLVNHFVEWCRTSHLLLNVAKTKEVVVVDYSGKRTTTNPITIKGQEV